MAILANLLVRLGVDADRVDEQLGRVGSFFQRHSGKIAAAGAALGAGGGAALVTGIQAGIEKEALGDKLAAQLGATEPEAARLGKVAGNVYSQGLGDGLDQVHDAVGAVVSSIDGMRGASDKAVEGMTVKVLNLAKAFEIDVARSAQVVGQIVKSGLVKDADQGMDLLTASLQKVPAAVREDLLDALDEYSPFMQQIGVTGQKAFNLLVQSAEKGAFGLDKTGDALKEFTLRATDMSEGTKEAFDAIGVNQKKMTADLLAGGQRGEQAFQKIISGLLGMKDPTERAQAAIALFGTPLEDLSTQDIPKFLQSLDTTKDTLGDTSGAADRLGQTLNDNAATGIESWKRKTDEAMASLVNAPGIMGDTAQAATGITQSLAPVGQSLGGLALTAFVTGQSLGGLGGKMKSGLSKVGGAMGTAATSVGKGAGRIATAAGRAGTAMTRMAGTAIVAAGRMAGQVALAAGRVVASWVRMAVQALIQAARMAVSWIIAMGPIGWVIAIIVIIVALIIANWDKVRAFMISLWEKVKSATLAAWNWIKEKISQAINLIKTIFFNFHPVGIIIKHWDKIKSATVAAWNWIKQKISAVWNGIKSAISGAANRIKSLVTNAWNAIKTGNQRAWNAIRNFIVNAWNRIKTAVSNGINRVVGLARGIKNRIKSAVGNLGSLLYNAGRNVVQGLINGITSKFGALADKAREMASKIRNVLPFSPAKEGPLSGRGSPELAGRRIGDMVAAGMTRGTGAVAAAAAGMAGAAAVHPGMAGAAAARTATPAGVRAAGGAVVIELRGDDSRTTKLVMELLRKGVAEAGGDVQRVLGRG